MKIGREGGAHIAAIRGRVAESEVTSERGWGYQQDSPLASLPRLLCFLSCSSRCTGQDIHCQVARKRQAIQVCILWLAVVSFQVTILTVTVAVAEQGGRDTARSMQVGENVKAAIAHFGQRVRSAEATAKDFEHLAKALRFSGRLAECASVLEEGVRSCPALFLCNLRY